MAAPPVPIVGTCHNGKTITFHIHKNANGSNSILGRGGEGFVYRGTLDHSGRIIDVAVKVIRLPDYDKEPGLYTSLIRRIANSITASYFLSIRRRCNPHIVCLNAVIVRPKIYEQIMIQPALKYKPDYVYTNNTIDSNLCYLLYELINGHDLQKHFRLVPVHMEINYPKYGTQLLETLNLLHNPSPKATLAAAAVEARALAEADPTEANKNAAIDADKKVRVNIKSRTFVHLDIKTENVMIDNDDNLRLIDMGSTCLVYSPNCKRETWSYYYSGPEAHGRYEKSVAKLQYSDVFATGILLYEMIMRPSAAGRLKYAVPLEEDSYGAYTAFWAAKEQEAAAGPQPGSEDIPGELNLQFSPEKMFLKPLIDAMTKRDYKERPTIAQSFAIWKELFSRDPRPTVAEAKEIIAALYVPEDLAEPEAAAAQRDPGGGAGAEGGRRTRKRRKNRKTRKARAIKLRSY